MAATLENISQLERRLDIALPSVEIDSEEVRAGAYLQRTDVGAPQHRGAAEGRQLERVTRGEPATGRRS